MDLNMNDLVVTPSRYSVRLGDKPIGYCMIINDLWTFFCSLDNSCTKGPTPDLAIARKLARMKLSQKPDDR